MLNHTINLDFDNKIYVMINIEAIPKFDIKSDIKFDISIKPTTWIGHKPRFLFKTEVKKTHGLELGLIK